MIAGKCGVTHGYSTRISPGYPTYQAWTSMRHRCTNPNNAYYARYGGRGIKVCAEWSRFENFLADMGDRPHGLSLDRIDNDGDYCKENCRWTTVKEQARNRGTSILVSYQGKEQCIRAWAEELGINAKTLEWRFRTKKSPEIAFNFKRGRA